MNKKSGTSKDAADKLVKGIKRKTRKQYSAEEKIRIVLAGLRGEESIAALCRRELKNAKAKLQDCSAAIWRETTLSCLLLRTDRGGCSQVLSHPTQPNSET